MKHYLSCLMYYVVEHRSSNGSFTALLMSFESLSSHTFLVCIKLMSKKHKSLIFAENWSPNCENNEDALRILIEIKYISNNISLFKLRNFVLSRFEINLFIQFIQLYLIEGNYYETRQSSLLYVIVPYFVFDRVRTTICDNNKSAAIIINWTCMKFPSQIIYNS